MQHSQSRPFKCGFLNIKNCFGIWKSRYFHLDGCNFHEFNNNQSHLPNATIDLANFNVGGVKHESGNIYFTLVNTVEPENTIEFHVLTQSEAHEWIIQLTNSIKLIAYERAFYKQCDETIPIENGTKPYQTDRLKIPKQIIEQINHHQLPGDWKLVKSNKWMRVYQLSTNDSIVYKGEWTINHSLQKVAATLQDEKQLQKYQMFLKHQIQVHENEFQSKYQIYYKGKQYQIDQHYERHAYLGQNKTIITKQHTPNKHNSQTLQEIITIAQDQDIVDKSYGQIIVCLNKKALPIHCKFTKEYINNYQILNYEIDLIEQSQNSTVKLQTQQSITNTVQSMNQYFLPNDQLDYVDPNPDRSHQAFHHDNQRINSLTEDEIIILNEFRELMSEFQLNDNTLIRHLQARQFIIPAAKEMLTNVYNWRKSNNINQISVNQFQQFQSKNIQFIIGEGLLGHPILYLAAMNLLPGQFKDDSEYSMSNYTKFFCALIEMRGDIDCQIFIIDCYKLSRKNVSTDLIKNIITYVFGNYPERQCRNIVINCDFLSKSVYNLIKNFLPKRTIDKMAFAGHDHKEIQEVLLKDMDINVIPMRYGGYNKLVQ